MDTHDPGAAAARTNEQLFRIDFNCGCTIRLFYVRPPEVTVRPGFDPSHPDCVLQRMVFVALPVWQRE